MSPRSKKEYLDEIHARYKGASRKEKTAILDEFCTVCGYHRKHAVRLLRALRRHRRPEPKRKGRAPVYHAAAVLKPLRRIRLAANLPCSKRLKAILPLWLPFYEGPLSEHVRTSLLGMSSSTMDRLLGPTRARHKGRGRSATKPGTLLRHHIPVKTNQWDESRPGFVEADTVAHCGTSMAGSFAFSLDCVDIATGWTEQRAVWGKGETDVLLKVRDIEASLPFPLLGFDSDNGSEFLNYHLFRHFAERKAPVQFTRSRAYHKDDNAHVEQKNWTHIRQWLGYGRMDNPEVVPLLNDLYTEEWRLFHNFFCPSVKLISKSRIASKTIKRYDKPKTPYQRVMESEHIGGPVKERLTGLFRTLNPFVLRRAMGSKIDAVFRACSREPGSTPLR